MMLSELAAKIQNAGDLDAYSVYLAEPDRDGVDVDLASIGRVELHTEKGEAQLFPSSTDTDLEHTDPEPYLGMVLDELPLLTSRDSDMRLVAEAPLLRDDLGDTPVAFTDVVDICIGRSSQEVWLLLRPASAFADGLLPT